MSIPTLRAFPPTASLLTLTHWPVTAPAESWMPMIGTKSKRITGNYLQTIYDIQRDLNGNYGETGGHWNIRDYTVDTTQTGPIGTTGPSQINCSALSFTA